MLFFIDYLISVIFVFFQSFRLPDFNAVFFSLSLFFEFLLISDSYHGLSSPRTTIVLLGMHNFANSM